MSTVIRKIEQEQLKNDIPEFDTGDSVKVHTRVKEGNKERIQLFAGIVIAKKGTGVNQTFTVRNTGAGDLTVTSPATTTGDITAGALVSRIWDSDEPCLFIDLGTNGELVFGNRDFLMSCACSAGPAFEGGDISCGMRAIDGAIESCTIDALSKEPAYSVIGGGKPVGLCGSGIIDLIASLFRRGIINARGAFERESARVKIDTDGMGRYILCFQEDSDTGREIAITSVDIDNFIRAKGAIFSAIQTMLASLDMDAGAIGRVLVAGGIGSGINIQNAIQIGMFPDIPLENYAYIGNAALSGAYAAIVSQKASDKLKEVAANMTYLELSAIPSYMDAFVAACFLPHTDAALFPSLHTEGAV